MEFVLVVRRATDKFFVVAEERFLLSRRREHWPHLRTTNVIESPFATVRLHTTAAQRFKKVENATALIWKVLQVAESTFRTLKGAKVLPVVYAGEQ